MEKVTLAHIPCVRLIRRSHPLLACSAHSQCVTLKKNENLKELLHQHKIDERWIVEIGGLELPSRLWPCTRVKSGQIIECRPIVGDEDTLRMAAFVVLSYYTFGVGGMGAAQGAFMGMTGASGWAAASLAFFAGVQVINQLLPMPSAVGMSASGGTTDPTYSLNGGRNGMRPWQPLGLVLGEPYVVPDLAGQSYTRFVGEDQYLTMVFHFGLNCSKVSQLKIGETDLGSYEGVVSRRYGLSGNQEIDIGLPSNNVDTIAGALLDAPGVEGVWTVRTGSVDAVRLEIDLEMALFSVNTGSGAYQSSSVQIDVQYAASGSSNWIDHGRKSYSHASTKPLRMTIAIDVAKGQYDVRLRKVTYNSTSSSEQNAVTWTQLKSFQVDVESYPGQSLLAMTIKSSGQLNGSIDTFNAIATAAPHQYWDGTGWVTATNRLNGLSNPGALILLLGRGIYDENNRLVAGLGWPMEMIDVETLKLFMMWCSSKGFTFDAFIQEPISTFDLLSAIAYAGLGSIDFPGGKLSVRWLTDTSPIEGVISMGNIKARSFNVAWMSNDRADEIEYGYFDRGHSNTWTSLRVTAPGVEMPRNTARLSNMGITTEAHAAVLARHAMAQNLYMSKTINLEMDLEHLSVRRGTVVALSHDMTQWGYSGRLKKAEEWGGLLVLTLDDFVPGFAGGIASPRFIGLRLLGETQFRVFGVQSFRFPTKTISLSEPWPTGVPLPGDAGTIEDCLWIYDFKPQPGLKAVVTSVEPDDTGSARVTLAPVNDEFWPYVWSGIYTPPPSRKLPDLTVSVSNLVMSEMLKRQGNTWAIDLTLSFDASDGVHRVEIWRFVGEHFADDSNLTKLGETRSRSFTWPGSFGETWRVELRPFDRFDRVGAASLILHAVQGLDRYPADVEDLELKTEESGIRVTWAQSHDSDYATTILKVGETWESAAEILRKSSTSHLLPFQKAGELIVWAAHMDTSGNVSLDPAHASLTISNPNAINFTRIEAHVNTVSLGWGDAKSSQPIKSYAIYIGEDGAAFKSAALYGKAGADSRSDVVIFTSSGSKRIFMIAEDVAGNTSIVSSVDVSMTLPVNFVLSREWNADWSGVKTNAVLIEDGYLYLPIADESWGDAPGTSDAPTTQAEIDVGLMYEFQPSQVSGSYSEEHDIGKLLSSTKITVSTQSITLIGIVIPIVQIEWRADATDAWHSAPLGVNSTQTNACRYVRVTWSVTADGDDDLVRLQNVHVTVESEQKTEFAQFEVIASDADGTPYVTTKGFGDVVSAVFTPIRSTASGDSVISRWNVYIDDAGSPESPARVFVMAWDDQANRVSGKGSLQIGGY